MTIAGFVPGPHLVDSLLDGGFRFAEMSHKGSILLLPTGVFSWHPRDVREIAAKSFDQVISLRASIDFLLIGTGENVVRLHEEVSWALRESKVRWDVMTTMAAARTYNIMLAENRRVAASLIAVGIKS